MDMDPVLFLGLGGTGKQTLMHLRRLIMDNYGGDLPKPLLNRYGPGRLPHTAFLCFDADTQLTDLDGKPFDELLRAAELRKDSEFHSVEIDVETTKELYRHPERFPAYQPWYDFSLAKFNVPRDGCGQTRPWGRLAFFQHYDRIRKQLRQALGSEGLLSVQTESDARAMGVEMAPGAPIQVYVVFSVAGGTGSGMFLDMAFLLRDLESELGRTIKTEALILLPEAFDPTPEGKIYANAYAALLELEHYSLQRGDVTTEGFPVYWPSDYRADRGPRRLEAPAFGAVWMIGKQPRGTGGGGASGLSPNQKSELTGMMAEWLFLRASPKHATFGNMVNTDASNFQANQMSETARVPIYEGLNTETGQLELSRRFGSFGLAKIYLPKRVLHQISAHRLSREVVERWRQPTELPANSPETIAHEAHPDVLLRIGHANGPDREGAEAIFEYIDRGEGSTSIIDEALRAFDEAFDPVALAQQYGPDLPARLNDELRGFLRKRIDDTEAVMSAKGEAARLIHERADAAMRHIRRGLNKHIGQALRTPGRRRRFAEEILTKLSAEFTAAEEDANRGQADSADEAQESRTLSEEVLRHARTERSAFVLRTVARVSIEDQKDSIESELRRQIYVQVRRVAADALKLITQADDLAQAPESKAGLQQQLANLFRSLGTLSTRIDERLNGLKSRSSSILNVQVIGKDTDELYVDRDGKPMTAAAIAAVEDRLYADTTVFQDRVGTPWSLRADFEGAGFAQTLERLVNFAMTETEETPRRANNALATFGAQYPSEGGSTGYVEALRSIVNHSTAWLSVKSTSNWGGKAPLGENYIVARAPGSGVEETRFSNMFEGPQAQFASVKAHEAGVEVGDAVYFTQYIAGFPLSEAPQIKAYRDRAYIPHLTSLEKGAAEAPTSALHLERNAARYSPLVRPTAEEAIARSSGLELLAEALVKGVLRPRRDEAGGVAFVRDIEVGFKTREEELGRYERVAIHLSAPESKPRRELEAAVLEAEEVWSRLVDGGRQTKARIVALLHYYNDKEDTPIKLQEWYTATERCIARLTARYGKEIVAAAKQEAAVRGTWTREDPAGSGFLTILD
jgi:hypothetical protein